MPDRHLPRTRTLLAGAATIGALTLGTAGLAGADTTTPAATGSTANHAALCAKAEARVPKIQAREAKASAFVTKAEAREAKATAAGHTKIAARITKRIDRVKKLEARGQKVLSKIASRCSASSSTSTT